MTSITTFAFWAAALDIVIVAYLVYRVLLVIKDTRAFQVLIGLLVIALMYVMTPLFRLYTLNWILKQFLSPFIIIIIILFQDDIRRGLARVGKNPFLASLRKVAEAESLEELVKASLGLAKKKVGALIVIEREMRLTEWLESGVRLDARIAKEMISSIFLPTSPIHDGALVVRSGRLVAAGVILPLTQDPNMSRALGTRHRAAKGITEVSDAVALVVSEEDGTLSIVVGGRIQRDLDGPALRKTLSELFGTPREDSRPMVAGALPAPDAGKTGGTDTATSERA